MKKIVLFVVIAALFTGCKFGAGEDWAHCPKCNAVSERSETVPIYESVPKAYGYTYERPASYYIYRYKCSSLFCGFEFSL